MIQNLGVDEKLFAYITNSVSHTPYYNLVKIKLTALGPGKAEFEISPDTQHTNPMGLIHGGVIMSIADAAMGNAIRSLGIKGVTVDCSTSFIASASLSEPLVARGQVVKAGSKLVFTRAEVLSNGKIVADAKATFANMGVIDPLKEGGHHQ